MRNDVELWPLEWRQLMVCRRNQPAFCCDLQDGRGRGEQRRRQGAGGGWRRGADHPGGQDHDAAAHQPQPADAQSHPLPAIRRSLHAKINSLFIWVASCLSLSAPGASGPTLIMHAVAILCSCGLVAAVPDHPHAEHRADSRGNLHHLSRAPIYHFLEPALDR